MNFQINETIGGTDPEVILELLATQLRRICKQIVCLDQTIEAHDIRPSSSSIVQNSRVVVSARANKTSCLLTANVSYRPSFAFWLFLGLGLLTALGWLIPIAFYMSQKSAVRTAVEDVLRRVEAECEFNGSSGAPHRSSRSDDAAQDAAALRNDAERGVPHAQAVLADAYYYGDGVPQNYAESARWFQKAAEQGDRDAQYNLGDAYRTGRGVTRDYAESARWFRKAAEQGDTHAQTNLGSAYSAGVGVSQDHVEAAHWFSLAAKQGDENAIYNLNLMRKRGQL